jgi:hypothetical protein
MRSSLLVILPPQRRLGAVLVIGDGALGPGESGTVAVVAARMTGESSGSIKGANELRISVVLSQEALRWAAGFR